MNDNKYISRRESIKRICTVAGMMAVSPSLIHFCHLLANPAGNFSLSADHFSADSIHCDRFFINRIHEVLKADKYPQLPKEPNKRRYEIYSLVVDNKLLHKASILLNVKDDLFSIEHYRSGATPDKHGQFTFIEQKVRPDIWYSPINWSYQSYLAKTANDTPYGIPLEGKGIYNGKDIITITEGSMVRNYHSSIAVTMKWNLLYAISDIVRTELPSTFQVIDEYDVLTGERILQPFSRNTIETDGKTINLQAYVMTGQGVLPTFYWLNEAGMLLFVNSGSEVYVVYSL